MKKHALPAFLSALGLSLATVQAATIVTGDVDSNIGPNFLLNDAAGGGGDFSVSQSASANFDRSFGALNVGAGGSDITVSGIGWATHNSATANDATSATVTITYLGLDGSIGGADDVVIGSVTDNFTFAANGEYYWEFDTAISATIDGTNNLFRVAIAPANGTSNGSLSFKTSLNNPNGNASNAKISVAGTSVAVVPEPSVTLLGAVGIVCLMRRRRG